MDMSRPYRAAEKGSALLMAVFMLVLLGAMGVVLLNLSTMEQRSSNADIEAKQLFFLSEAGIEERRPETEEEWAQVEGAAAMLVEAGSLLTTPNRMKDDGDWVRMAQGLADAAAESLRAVEARDAEELFASGEALVTACDACHNQYQLEAAY